MRIDTKNYFSQTRFRKNAMGVIIEVLLVIILILVLILIGAGICSLFRYLKPDSTKYERFIGVLLIYAVIKFYLGLGGHSIPHFQEIDPFVDPCYSPLSYKFATTLIVFHILSLISMGGIYFKGTKLAPILISLCIAFLTIGICLNIQFLVQISSHDISRVNETLHGSNILIGLRAYPILLILTSIGLFVRLIKNKANLNKDIKYQNKWLDFLNQKLSHSTQFSLISILLSIPVFLIIIILILFGQEYDSLYKVYTDTATWKFSQEIHPPIVDNKHGHYLCTVAAMGTPKIVKPIRIGYRHRKPIIVNRQLQIANAFEQMVEDISPKAHKVIRRNYDNYGFNLSKKINNERLSNFAYLLMKPLEWLFLVALYSYYQKPEQIIKRQYRR